MYTYDPWERLNRFTYRFNARFDEAIFLPVADTYRRAPRPIRAGIHNFFDNLAEIDSVINYTLQWRLKYGLRSLERLAINSTIGIGGLFDVATKLKLARHAHRVCDNAGQVGHAPGTLSGDPVVGSLDAARRRRLSCRLWRGIWHQCRGFVSRQRLVGRWERSTRIDQRANIDFRYYSGGSPFEYETIRFLYVRRRLIEDRGIACQGTGQEGAGRCSRRQVSRKSTAVTGICQSAAGWRSRCRGFRLSALSEISAPNKGVVFVKSPLMLLCSILVALSGLSGCQKSEVTAAVPRARGCTRAAAATRPISNHGQHPRTDGCGH